MSCNQASDKQPAKEKSEIMPDTIPLIDSVDQYDTFVEFPGGKDSLLYFINKNLIVPNEVKEHNICGRVFIRFMITEEGKVIKPSIIRSLSKEADEEALRIINLFPDFIPATSKGKSVKSYYGIYVDFNG